MFEEVWLLPVVRRVGGRSRAIDIGANDGSWSQILSWSFARVDAYEPDYRVRPALRSRFTDSDRVFVHSAAVAAEEGEGTFMIRTGEAQSSLLAGHPFGHGDVVDTRVVECVTLPQVVGDGADFVKIDIEGGEEFLDYPDNVGAYLIECHGCFERVLERIPLCYDVRIIKHPVPAAAAEGHCWLFAEKGGE